MNLLLTYFDDLIGPKLFLSLPEDIPSDSKELITSFMDLRIPNGFFELVINGKKYYNYSFSIPSSKSRGGDRILMLSAMFERQLESVMTINIFQEIAQKLHDSPNIDKGFLYPNMKNADIRETYEKIVAIMKLGYIQLKNKTEQISFIDNLFNQKALDADSTTGNIVRAMATAFITAIDARIPEGANLLFEVGTILGNKFEQFFSANDSDHLLEELGRFWKRHGFGVIDEIQYEDKQILFNVYDCFECQHLPNIGQTVCRFDEGFLSKVADIKLGRKYSVKEIECYATGKDHCRFELKPII